MTNKKQHTPHHDQPAKPVEVEAEPTTVTAPPPDSSEKKIIAELTPLLAAAEISTIFASSGRTLALPMDAAHCIIQSSDADTLRIGALLGQLAKLGEAH